MEMYVIPVILCQDVLALFNSTLSSIKKLKTSYNSALRNLLFCNKLLLLLYLYMCLTIFYMYI